MRPPGRLRARRRLPLRHARAGPRLRDGSSVADGRRVFEQITNVAMLPGIVGTLLHARRALGLRASRSAVSPHSTAQEASSPRAGSASTSTAACASACAPALHAGRGYDRSRASSWTPVASGSRPARGEGFFPCRRTTCAGARRAGRPVGGAARLRRAGRSGASRSEAGACGEPTPAAVSARRGPARPAARSERSDRATTTSRSRWSRQADVRDAALGSRVRLGPGRPGGGHVPLRKPGFGHQVATDYVQSFLRAMPGEASPVSIVPRARCAPYPFEGRPAYFSAMCCAATCRVRRTGR